jgi:hypothetical protein
MAFPHVALCVDERMLGLAGGPIESYHKRRGGPVTPMLAKAAAREDFSTVSYISVTEDGGNLTFP